MQDNSAKKNDAANRADQNADDEINRRLAEHLKANAIRTDRSPAPDKRIPQRGFFAEAFAMIGLVGLMIVAYVYTLLVGKEA
jgi:hypothetical protein